MICRLACLEGAMQPTPVKRGPAYCRGRPTLLSWYQADPHVSGFSLAAPGVRFFLYKFVNGRSMRSLFDLRPLTASLWLLRPQNWTFPFTSDHATRPNT